MKKSSTGNKYASGIWRTISFLLIFTIVCFVLFLIWVQVVIVEGSKPSPIRPGPTNSVTLDAINVDMPQTAEVGEDIQIHARFTNLGLVSVESITVQISQEFLNVFELESSVPQYYETHKYEWLNENYQSFVFDVSIPPGETYNFEFNGAVMQKGNYYASILICVGGDWDCAGFSISTKIE